ncbi:MAG: hypothetical protein AAF558_12735 [Verrucomicrobiota bacterium]
MLNLIEIVKNECISARNCMLSLYNEQGDSGFLYFKEAQLIEVNAGKLWGKEALAKIVGWMLSSYTITELPRGIKRTIWEPLDQIFAELVGQDSASSIGEVIGKLQMDDLEESAPIAPALHDPLAPLVKSLEQLPGFLAVFKEVGNEIRPLAGTMPSKSLSTDWFPQFTERSRHLGEGLGAGMLREWFIEVDECRIWYVPAGESNIIIFSSVDGMVEDFEQGFRVLLP